MTYNLDPKTINLDWLTLKCSGELSLDSESEAENHINTDLVLIGKGYGTKIYQHSLKIIYQGVEFGTLLCEPRQQFLDEKGIQIDLKNERLYESDIIDVAIDVIEQLGVSFKFISRLEKEI